MSVQTNAGWLLELTEALKHLFCSVYAGFLGDISRVEIAVCQADMQISQGPNGDAVLLNDMLSKTMPHLAMMRQPNPAQKAASSSSSSSSSTAPANIMLHMLLLCHGTAISMQNQQSLKSLKRVKPYVSYKRLP